MEKENPAESPELVVRPQRRRTAPNATSAQQQAPPPPPPLTCEQLLAQLERCASDCRRVEQVLGGRGAPELETIIQLHRLLILRFSLEAGTAPDLLKLVDTLMKPVMDWARLEEKRKERELAEQKYRDEQAAAQAEREREQKQAEEEARAADAAPDGPLRPGTLEKIQEELSLL